MGVTDQLSVRLVDLAARHLPPHRADWALAMRAEHGEALDAGRGMSFACGCLIAAFRARLVHSHDQFAIGRCSLVLVTLMPLAIFHFGCGYGSFRFAFGVQDHFHSALLAGTEAQRQIAASYEAAAPLFGGLLIAMAVSHLIAGWHLVTWRQRKLCVAMAVALLAALGLAVTIHKVMGGWNGVALQFSGLGVEAVLFGVFALWAELIRPHRLNEATERTSRWG